MNCIKTLGISVIAVLLTVTPLAALTKVTTMESKVVVVPSTDGIGQTTFKVMGPEKIEYRIDAPQAELDRLAALINSNPDQIVRFNGEIMDDSGRNTFRVSRWETTETTTTTNTTDALGREKVSTETRTETHPK